MHTGMVLEDLGQVVYSVRAGREPYVGVWFIFESASEPN